MLTETLDLTALAAALGLGMLVGLERERHKGSGECRAFAGLRSYAITALLGYVAMVVGGMALLAVCCVCLALLITAAYCKHPGEDPGITSEIALLLVLVLGGLCRLDVTLAVAIGVLLTLLLAHREKLHRFARHQLSETEVHDGLTLLTVALVVLPLTPDRYLGPYQAINLRTICTLTVLLMSVSALGHIALRLVGARYGYILSAIASGFASGSATIAAMGQLARKTPAAQKSLSAAAVLSNLATHAQVALIALAVDAALLRGLAGPLLLGTLCMAVYGLLLMSSWQSTSSAEPAPVGGAFNLKLALLLALAMTVISVLASALLARFGDRGLLSMALLSGLADAHAITASISSLTQAGQVAEQTMPVLVLSALTSNSLSKCLLAWISGGRPFAVSVISGQILIVAGLWTGLLWR